MKIDDICKSCYGNNVGVLIRRLNPVIRGTANYWRHVVSKKVFGAMDDYSKMGENNLFSNYGGCRN